MSIPTRQNPSPWQSKAINGIVRRMSGKRPAKAALLQLPTGFGKSLVAVRIFEKLAEQRPGLRLVIVLPKQQSIPDGWMSALGYRCGPDGDEVNMFEWLTPPAFSSRKERVLFWTLRELQKAMLCNSGGRPPWFATEVHGRPYLIVVDEIHKHRRILETLSEIFLEQDDDLRVASEQRLTKPFRRPIRGRRTWPRWLLLSATPFNPVSLDAIDPLDRGKKDDTFENRDVQDEEALADEIQKTLGGLAFLTGAKPGEWFSRHVNEVRKRLGNGDSGKPVNPPRQLVVWPKMVKDRAFRPPARTRWTPPEPMPNDAGLRLNINELVRTAKLMEQGSTHLIRRRATTERFVLSGGHLHVEGHEIEGQLYSSALARCVARAVAARKKLGCSRPAKLEALVKLIRKQATGEHVLVFCVHRAIGLAVVKELGRVLGESSVKNAIGGISDSDRNWFNESTLGETRALVATDACSESIDLHERADILVHYELPWSPLRVLQRVGRLWRIRQNEIKTGQRPKTPRLPGIVHFAHPGSVDEEILSRLYRRWIHLKVMGLDYLDYSQAMGVRLPAVHWNQG